MTTLENHCRFNKYGSGFVAQLSLLLQMFILFYQIPFTSYVNTMTLYALYAFCMILFKYRFEFRKLGLNLQKYYKLFMAFGLYLVIISLACLIYNTATETGVLSSIEYFRTIYRFIIRTMLSFLVAGYLAILCVKKKITFDKLMQLFVLMGCIQFIFVIITFISPTVKTFFLEYISENINESSRIRELILNRTWTTRIRMFGLAGNTFEPFAFVSVMFFMAAVYLGFKRKWLYFLLIPAPLFSTAVNSRTGVLLCVVTALCFIGKLILNNHCYRYKTLVFLFFTIVLCSVGMILLSQMNNASAEWLLEAGSSIIALKSGISNTTGSLNTLLTSHVVFPNSVLNLIFGEGYTITLPGITNTHSDIGYINVIWACGLFGSALLYYIHISFFLRAYKIASSRMIKTYLLCVAIAFFLMHYKIICFGTSPTTIITYFIMLYIFDAKERDMSCT